MFHESLFNKLTPELQNLVIRSINTKQTEPLTALTEIRDRGVRGMLLERDPMFTLIINSLYTHVIKKARNESVIAWAELIFNNKPMPDTNLRHDIVARYRKNVEKVFAMHFDHDALWYKIYGK
jgi:uncharacterized protein YozE (UPF0346 family)